MHIGEYCIQFFEIPLQNLSSLMVDSYNRVKQRVIVLYKRLKKSRLYVIFTYNDVRALSFQILS
jgi:hypothetical protein